MLCFLSLLQKASHDGLVLLGFFDEWQVSGLLKHYELCLRHQVFVLNGEPRYRGSIPSAGENQSGRLDFLQPGTKIQGSQFPTQQNIRVRSSQPAINVVVNV